MTFLLWFLSSLATLPLSVHSRHAKCWTSAAFSVCSTTSGEQDQHLTGVDVLDAVYVIVVNFVAPLTLMAFFYSRILLGAGTVVSEMTDVTTR